MAEGSLTSPEAVLMLTTAGILDCIGLIFFILSFVFGIGIPLSWILDIIGLIILGTWMYWRSGSVTVTKGTKKIISKTSKRLGLAFLGELIPFFGDVAFCWTLAVYLELKKG